MDTPRFKIGDKVYMWHTSFEPPKCPTCQQDDYAEKNYDDMSNWQIKVQESTVEGIQVQEGIRELGDGVSYQLDTEHWTVDEDRLYASHDEALAVAQAHVKERQDTNRKAAQDG